MKPMHTLLGALACASTLWVHAEPAIFKGADLKLGEKLIAEHNCSACHAQKVGGNGSAIYKPKGRLNTPGLMRGMVEQCNTMMNFGLNRDYYKFKN
jgi:cytochrome c553